jgi:hypothetical protein
VSAMVCRAWLRRRSPPRLRRWLVVLPLLAGMGLAPAGAASVWQRPGWNQDTTACAAVTGPMAGRLSSWRARSVTMLVSYLIIELRSE